MHDIMSCTDAADWKRWASETLALRTNQSGKGLHVQHWLSVSIHFTFDCVNPIQSRVHTQNRFSKRERIRFFLNQSKYVAVPSVIFKEKYMGLYKHCF